MTLIVTVGVDGSEARTLTEGVGPELRYAGVRILAGTRLGAEYWQEFVDLVKAALASIG